MADYTITGVVVDSDGEPVGSQVVTINQVDDLTSVTALGTGTTNPGDGTYSVTFTTTGGDGIDLQGVVDDGAGGVLATSHILFDSEEGSYRIDFITGSAPFRGRSRYTEIQIALDATRGTRAYVDITPDDLEFLAGRSRLDPVRIGQFVQAHRLAAANPRVSAEVFFALLHRGLAPDLGEMMAQGDVEFRRAIEAASGGNVIPEMTPAEIDAAIVSLAGLCIDVAVYANPTGPEKSAFRALMDTAVASGHVGETELRAFLQVYQDHNWTTREDFWTEVENDSALSAAHRATLEFTMSISATSGGFLPLMDALQAKRLDAGDPVNEHRDLTSLSRADWVDLLEGGSSGPALGVPERIPTSWSEANRVARYADTLYRIVTDAHPTAAIARAIEREEAANPGSIDGAADLILFIDNNRNFSFASDRVDVFLDDNPGALTGLADPAGAPARIKKIQRLYVLAPKHARAEAVVPLYKADVHSALGVHGYGLDALKQDFALQFDPGGVDGNAICEHVFANATHVTTTVGSVLAKYGPVGNNLVPVVGIEAVNLDPAGDAYAATLKSLFDTFEYCECEHCQSVFGPAAYLVDILRFLQRQPGDTQANALAELAQRRPEVTKIDLNCKNTNTVVPYIDLVNEVLETAVSGNAQPEEFWQSTWESEELQARPEHRDDDAYTATVAALYPFNLPFDRARRESDAYFEQLGLGRDQMVELYASDHAEYLNLLARARLRMSDAMWDLITNPGPGPQRSGVQPERRVIHVT